MKIKELRKQKKLSQAELGEKLGLTSSAICQYEKGNRSPDSATLLKMAEFFGVSVDYILKDEDEKKEEASTEKVKNVHLYEARKRLQLTAAQVAEKIGVSLSFYARIENGTITPTEEIYKSLSKALHITVDYIKGGYDKLKEERIDFAKKQLAFIDFIQSGKSRFDFYKNLTEEDKKMFIYLLLISKEELLIEKKTFQYAVDNPEHALFLISRYNYESQESTNEPQ